jgi:hypothetical protein
VHAAIGRIQHLAIFIMHTLLMFLTGSVFSEFSSASQACIFQFLFFFIFHGHESLPPDYTMSYKIKSTVYVLFFYLRTKFGFGHKFYAFSSSNMKRSFLASFRFKTRFVRRADMPMMMVAKQKPSSLFRDLED